MKVEEHSLLPSGNPSILETLSDDVALRVNFVDPCIGTNAVCNRVQMLRVH